MERIPQRRPSTGFTFTRTINKDRSYTGMRLRGAGEGSTLFGVCGDKLKTWSLRRVGGLGPSTLHIPSTGIRCDCWVGSLAKSSAAPLANGKDKLIPGGGWSKAAVLFLTFQTFFFFVGHTDVGWRHFSTARALRGGSFAVTHCRTPTLLGRLCPGLVCWCSSIGRAPVL